MQTLGTALAAVGILCALCGSPVLAYAQEADIINPEIVADDAQTLYKNTIQPRAQEYSGKAIGGIEQLRLKFKNSLAQRYSAMQEHIASLEKTREESLAAIALDAIGEDDPEKLTSMHRRIRWDILGAQARKAGLSAGLFVCSKPFVFYGILVLCIGWIVFKVCSLWLRNRRRARLEAS